MASCSHSKGQRVVERIIRPFLRWYGGLPLRPGRSKIKFVARHLVEGPCLSEIAPGLRLHLDLNVFDHEKLFYFFEEYEPSLQWIIQRLFPVGGTFVDCGANVGFFGLAAIHWRGAKVVFIEPHPQCAEVIRLNLRANHFEGFGRVFQHAASDRSGLRRLTTRSDSGVTFHLKDEGETLPESIEVEVKTLDYLFREQIVRSIDLLKIDAEGYDFLVLRGLGEWLCPAWIRSVYLEGSQDGQAIWTLRRERGYTGFGGHNVHYYQVKRHERRHGQFLALTFLDRPARDMLWVTRGSADEAFASRWCRIHESLKR